jgi:methylenetetrahydrofolate dehydrogenase (NADP+) / methenyltetrahydrofolate cyclohydrolase
MSVRETQAHVIDGEAFAAELRGQLEKDMAELNAAAVRPGLATVLVGDDYAAQAYERRVRRLAEELGCHYVSEVLDRNIEQADALAVVGKLNADPRVSGILILRPLPEQVAEAEVYRTLDPLKDIEAVHPENARLLALGVPRFVPSTAASAFHLLDTWLESVGEDRAEYYHRCTIVVVGRSNNVGKPAISLGFERQTAVLSVDEWASRTGSLGRHTRAADVLIVAAGQAGLIKAEHVREHTIVIDVGINPMTGPDGRVRMVGDVEFTTVAERARAITPVPGGVGPVTDVWLLHNAVVAAHLRAGRPTADIELSFADVAAVFDGTGRAR